VFDPHRFYTPAEIRTISHAPRELVYRSLMSGELQALRRGRRYLIPGQAVIEWLDRVGR